MMNTVGPTTKRKKTSSSAAMALALERNCTPFSTPVTADATKQLVRTAITPTVTQLELPVPNTSSRPPVICRAPRPREVAEPNRVAKIAITSIALPGPSVARLPSSGPNAPDTRLPAPLR